jgi:hypothetical protein
LNLIRLFLLILLLGLPFIGDAQSKRDRIKGGYENDTIALKNHSPGKAALYSALLPGAGQFYNRKYWKMPVIYAGLFVVGGFVGSNNEQYNDYKNEAINRYNYGVVVGYPDLSDEEVLSNMEFYERRRNLNILILVGVYLLQIVDATVDAQFFGFDVSDDVTFRAEPYINQSEFNSAAPINTGITLSLKF